MMVFQVCCVAPEESDKKSSLLWVPPASASSFPIVRKKADADDATSVTSRSTLTGNRIGKRGGHASSRKSECEKLYGPYPELTPQPFVGNIRNEGREGDVAPNNKKTKKSKAPAKRGGSEAPAPVVDIRDQGTPDGWVPRHGELIRLTGKHPFNVEPSLKMLHQYQFLTPSSIQFVRNHGAVPKLSWDTHRLQVKISPQARTVEFSMDEIASFPAREFPVTLACSSNRRKEQNMVKRSTGFNWGPAACSTNVWKGAYLRDVLLEAGWNPRASMAGKHVEFIGYEDLPNKVGPGPFKQQPWGKQVKYGTSIPLAKAMNPANDVILAYQANGAPLLPDHGYPLRVIVPGHTSGRMVKWLTQINIIDHETYSLYHYHDNRVLPSHLDAEEALKGGWYYKPEYIINEQVIQSVICKPDHTETLSKGSWAGKRTFQVAGYAYTGGGRKITRVEVTVDGGRHWHLTTLDRKEQPTEYGMHWCWIWWAVELPRSLLFDDDNAKEIICRAWDETNNTQPLIATWNILGMGTNNTYRVKVHRSTTPSGVQVIKFEHPVQPGQQTGGWMTEDAIPDTSGVRTTATAKKSVVSSAKKAATGGKIGSKKNGKIFTMAEIEKHDSEKDCWIVVHNRVYDCTKYLELHPGGSESIVICGGTDCTEDFVAIHSTHATRLLENYYIGDLDVNSVSQAAAAPSANNTATEERKQVTNRRKFGFMDRLPSSVHEEKKSDELSYDMCSTHGRPLALSRREKHAFRLTKRTILSHDTFVLEFALPTKEHILGLPIGQHVFFSAVIDGETVLRRYTPITSDHDIGIVRFALKAYHRCPHHPNGGKMSQYLETLPIGEYLDMRGPIGKFTYKSQGKFEIQGKQHVARKFNMIAGGTGIAPVMQVADEILREHRTDRTQIALIFAAKDVGELMLRSTLDEWEAKHPKQFRVHYVLSHHWPEDWQYSTGHVSAEMFRHHLFSPGDKVYNLMCGPPGMIDEGCIPSLERLGHTKKSLFIF